MVRARGLRVSRRVARSRARDIQAKVEPAAGRTSPRRNMAAQAICVAILPVSPLQSK